jgi:ribosomal protein S18 acetylase RimI-like enzyme
MVELVHVTGAAQLEQVRELFLEYASHLGIDLSFQDFDTEVATLPGKYAPPDGALFIALSDGRPVGCIALRKITDAICEMKRLYVHPDSRGLGLGRKRSHRIIETAIARHYRVMRLDTLPSMKEAQDLYRSLGFYEIDPYVPNPVEGAKFMELNLEKARVSFLSKQK